MNRKRRMSASEPMPLRRETKQAVPTGHNMGLLECLVSTALLSGAGVYLKLSENTGVIRIKVYDGDEQYAEALYPEEDWTPLFADWCSQLGWDAVWKNVLAERWREARQAAPEAPGKGKAGSGPA